MFSSPYKEQQTSHVLLEHVSPWAVRRLLDFAYLGVLELSTTTVQDVFNAASLLDYPIAMKACIRFMEQHLDITNCLGVEALAELHGLTNLGRAARKMAVENFATLVLESNEWGLLPLSSVVSYVSSDDLDVPSEQCVWQACIAWIDHDPETRVTHFPTLLANVRLRHLERQFLAAQLNENVHLKENRTAQALVRQALERQSASIPFETDLPPRPATLKRPTLVVLGGLNSCILNCMQSFSPSKTAWLSCPSMPVDSLAWFSVAVVSNVLFVMGGIKAGTIMSAVYSYSPSRGRWSQCSPMPQARARHAAVAVGGSHIFVFGGMTMTSYDDDPPRSGQMARRFARSVVNMQPQQDEAVPGVLRASTIIRYDVCSDSWTIVGRSVQPRLESRVVIVDDEGSPLGSSPLHLSPQDDVACEEDTERISPEPDYPIVTADAATSTCSTLCESTRWHRHLSSHGLRQRTLVEIGGVTEAQPHGTDQVLFYCLEPDLTVRPTGDYIKLQQPIRYVSCAVQQVGNRGKSEPYDNLNDFRRSLATHLLYLFWEQTSELSVLDLERHTLRPLAPLALGQARIHAGFTWVGNYLYVVGGFSEFLGDDQRPTAPRDDVHWYNPETDSWCVMLCVCMPA
ncbi:kelch-like protein 17 (actinfilin) [Paragonimus westermani]|uniref:Kelch-like protein 17 (Actinfilin) n=1 Tax=Paragonimus westermani TaxID=34504 RepID=A0A5J4N8S5_9TREM|nr:kelch-like protein 17 (actinfilin) [Paragonimus westermani]